jgi:hypothetical protein
MPLVVQEVKKMRDLKVVFHMGNRKITELRTIFQRESQNSYDRKTFEVMTSTY